MKKLSFAFFLIGLLVLSIVPTMAQETAQLRVAHFLLGGGDVDVYINGELSAATRVGYGDVSEWYTIAPGTYSVAIAPARTSVDDAVLGPIDFTFDDGSWTTLAATGLAERGVLDLFALPEDYSPLTFNETRLSVFHAVSDGNPVDVTYNDELLFGLLAYPGSLGDNDGFDSRTLTVGSYGIEVLDNISQTSILDLGQVSLNDRNNYFVAVFGTAVNPTVTISTTNVVDATTVAIGDIRERPNADATDGYLRFAHFSSGTGDVDVYVNGDLAATSVGFAGISDFTVFAVGDYTISVAPAGTSADSAVLEYELRLFGGEYITVAFVGVIENRTLEAVPVFENFNPTDVGQTRVTFFNAVPGLQKVTLARNDGLLVVQDLAYPQDGSDGYAISDLVTGRYSFKVVDFTTPATLAEIPEFNYAASVNYFIAYIPGETGWVLTEAPIPAEEF
ncbi:MAG: DUF4397 domain-containing protein [bacterium]|nr:DUF4397 domain-containing protein [bacterium]